MRNRFGRLVLLAAGALAAGVVLPLAPADARIHNVAQAFKTVYVDQGPSLTTGKNC